MFIGLITKSDVRSNKLTVFGIVNSSNWKSINYQKFRVGRNCELFQGPFVPWWKRVPCSVWSFPTSCVRWWIEPSKAGFRPVWRNSRTHAASNADSWRWLPGGLPAFRRFDSESFQKAFDPVRNLRSIVQIHFGMYRKYISHYPRKSFQIILPGQQNRNRHIDAGFATFAEDHLDYP